MAKSNYFGVTSDGRSDKHKVQIFIAGKPRFFGYFPDDKEAAQVAENARLYLQEFFPKPPPPRKFDVVATTVAIEDMRVKLTNEGAPTFSHRPTGADTLSDEVDRLFSEVQNANSVLQHAIRRLKNAIKK